MTQISDIDHKSNCGDSNISSGYTSSNSITKSCTTINNAKNKNNAKLLKEW